MTLIFQFSFKFNKIARFSPHLLNDDVFANYIIWVIPLRIKTIPIWLIQCTAAADNPSLTCRKPTLLWFTTINPTVSNDYARRKKNHLLENPKTWFTFETWVGQTAGEMDVETGKWSIIDVSWTRQICISNEHYSVIDFPCKMRAPYFHRLIYRPY